MEGKYFANGKLSIIIIKPFSNIIVCGNNLFSDSHYNVLCL